MAKPKKNDFMVSVFVPDAPAPPAPRTRAAIAPASGSRTRVRAVDRDLLSEPLAQQHNFMFWPTGHVESVDPEEMKDQWLKTLEVLKGLGASLNETTNGWSVSEVSVGLTVSAKGRLLFIAEAGAQASVTVKLTRAKP